MTRLAYLWDEGKCVACMACVLACTGNYPELARLEEPNPMRRWLASNIRVVIREVGKPTLRLVSCQHCENPPCVHACPTGASHIDRRTGLVEIDYSKCIGCKACIVACPYGVRWLNPLNQLPMKCPGPVCMSLIERGEKPMCVQVCPANARDFGDIDDPSSSISVKLAKYKTERMLEHMGTQPKWFIIPRRGG